MTRPRAEKSHVDVLAWLIVLLVAAVVPEMALATTTTTSLPLAATLSRTESLVSPTGIFALGFFSLSTPGGGFGFGIWYQQLVSLEADPTVVWMPRRDLKLGRDSYLEFAGDGTLALFDPGWSTRQSVWTSGNTPRKNRYVGEINLTIREIHQSRSLVGRWLMVYRMWLHLLSLVEFLFHL